MAPFFLTQKRDLQNDNSFLRTTKDSSRNDGDFGAASQQKDRGITNLRDLARDEVSKSGDWRCRRTRSRKLGVPPQYSASRRGCTGRPARHTGAGAGRGQGRCWQGPRMRPAAPLAGAGGNVAGAGPRVPTAPRTVVLAGAAPVGAGAARARPTCKATCTATHAAPCVCIVGGAARATRASALHTRGPLWPAPPPPPYTPTRALPAHWPTTRPRRVSTTAPPRCAVRTALPTKPHSASYGRCCAMPGRGLAGAAATRALLTPRWPRRPRPTQRARPRRPRLPRPSLRGVPPSPLRNGAGGHAPPRPTRAGSPLWPTTATPTAVPLPARPIPASRTGAHAFATAAPRAWPPALPPRTWPSAAALTASRCPWPSAPRSGGQWCGCLPAATRPRSCSWHWRASAAAPCPPRAGSGVNGGRGRDLIGVRARRVADTPRNEKRTPLRIPNKNWTRPFKAGSRGQRLGTLLRSARGLGRCGAALRRAEAAEGVPARPEASAGAFWLGPRAQTAPERVPSTLVGHWGDAVTPGKLLVHHTEPWDGPSFPMGSRLHIDTDDEGNITTTLWRTNEGS
jgi:hypothetical protein